MTAAPGRPRRLTASALAAGRGADQPCGPVVLSLAVALFASALAGCHAPVAPPRAAARPPPPALTNVPAPASSPASAPVPAREAEEEAPPVPAPALDPSPLLLDEETASMALATGRSIVDVRVPASSHVSIGVFGPQAALLGLDVIAIERADDAEPLDEALATLRARRPLDEDSLLPRIVSFLSPPERAVVRLVVDAAEPVELRRVSAPPLEVVRIPKKGKPPPLVEVPVIGFPAPVTRDDGYFLQSAARYQFARTDVIAALVRAFHDTRARFRRDPIAVADISQWDGIRPATDLGHPRHISHEGGRDVDVALAASDEEPSTVRAHCTGVLVGPGVQGCGPGTARGFDALRMAYFLGLLFDTMPPVEKIFVDDVYLRELRHAADKLHDRRLLKDAGFLGLYDDAIVRASPWHTDHLHVRFAGPAGKPVF